MKPKTKEELLKLAEYRIATHISDAIWSGQLHAEEKVKALDDLRLHTMGLMRTLRENINSNYISSQKSDGISSKTVQLEGALQGIDRCIKIVEDCELNGLKWM